MAAEEMNEDNVFLLPCPFCGGMPSIQGSVRKWVACLDCGAETKRADDWPSVVEWWNRRPNTVETGATSTNSESVQCQHLNRECRLVPSLKVQHCNDCGVEWPC